MKTKTFYESVKDKLDAPVALFGDFTKRSFKEGSWNYNLFFYKDELKKVEAYNQRELIEVWDENGELKPQKNK